VGGHSNDSPTAASPERNMQAKDSGSFSFHVCGVFKLSVPNAFHFCIVPLPREIWLPYAAFIILRFRQVEGI